MVSETQSTSLPDLEKSQLQIERPRGPAHCISERFWREMQSPAKGQSGWQLSLKPSEPDLDYLPDKSEQSWAADKRNPTLSAGTRNGNWTASSNSLRWAAWTVQKQHDQRVLLKLPKPPPYSGTFSSTYRDSQMQYGLEENSIRSNLEKNRPWAGLFEQWKKLEDSEVNTGHGAVRSVKRDTLNVLLFTEKQLAEQVKQLQNKPTEPPESKPAICWRFGGIGHLWKEIPSQKKKELGNGKRQQQ